jgi:nucleoside-diphosphate-sugar epimerase
VRASNRRVATFLVTGAAGFIGSGLVRALLERGATVRGVDNFATGRRENLAGLAGVAMFEGDINDAALLDRAMAGADYVLHQAAIPSVPRSLEKPIETNRANVDGTLAVLEAARRARVKRVVYAGSSSAYGDTVVLPKVESMTPAPLSPYAVQKLTGEHYCRVYSRVYGLPCVTLRYFNVFGPRQDPDSPYAAVIPRFVRAILRGEAPEIFGDGKQTRDFTHLDNVIDANLLAASAPGGAGEVFNIACGAAIDLVGLVGAINVVLGTDVAPRFSPARAGDVRDSLADIGAAERVLGYRARVSVADGLGRAIAWYRENLPSQAC